MLRGPGKIQRAIALLCRQPRNIGATVTAAAIAREVYGVTFEQEPTRAQRVAILRAMHSFVRTHQAYRLAGGQGRTRLVIIPADEVEAFTKVSPVTANRLPPW